MSVKEKREEMVKTLEKAGPNGVERKNSSNSMLNIGVFMCKPFLHLGHGSPTFSLGNLTWQSHPICSRESIRHHRLQGTYEYEQRHFRVWRRVLCRRRERN